MHCHSRAPALRHRGLSARQALPLPALALALGLAAVAGRAPAQTPSTSRDGFSSSGLLTLGQAVRDSERNPELLSRLNAQAIGASGTASGGRNQDDGNLNFERGDPVSTVVKALIQVRWNAAPWAVVASGKAWYDHTLETRHLPWGNLPNGLRNDRPLSDAGFGARSRFSGAVLQEAYVQRVHAWGAQTLTWRLGPQSLGWGQPSLLGGGMRQVDAVDVPAARRPGSVAGETQAPAPALRGTLASPGGWRLDGFAQLRFEPNASVVCGTFHSVADYVDGGCDKAILGATANDRGNLAAGSYLTRAGVVRPGNGGQAGLALGYAPPGRPLAGTLYVARVHNRSLSYNMIKSGRTSGAPVVAGNPDGLNAQFEVEYAPGVRLFGVDGRLQALGGTWQAELTHTPNQPVPLNSGDLVGAFASAVSTPALLRADERATAPGARYRGYDRLRVSDARLSFSRTWRDLALAHELRLRLELAGKWVHDLPDVKLRRYRRPDVYGNGPVAGVCTGAPESKQCSNDGFVTAAAYGLRVQVASLHPLSDGLQLQPTLSFGQDLHGWSYDNVLGAGRRTLALAVRLAGSHAHGEVAVNRVWGNPYDNAADRDTVVVSVGTRF